MCLPDNFVVERRNVKHARLRVNEDESVNLFVPNSFTDFDIENLLKQKAQWIKAKQDFFKKKSKILLRRNEILLLGNRYLYYYSTQYKNKTIVNHESKTIQSQRDLLDTKIQEQWMKTEARKYIRERVKVLSENLFLPYNKLFIRSQKTKWGNCTKEGNISINWRIYKAPSFVIDYVIVHELCHIIVMKHSVRFQTFLKSHYPDTDEAREWLDKYGNSL